MMLLPQAFARLAICFQPGRRRRLLPAMLLLATAVVPAAGHLADRYRQRAWQEAPPQLTQAAAALIREGSAVASGSPGETSALEEAAAQFSEQLAGLRHAIAARPKAAAAAQPVLEAATTLQQGAGRLLDLQTRLRAQSGAAESQRRHLATIRTLVERISLLADPHQSSPEVVEALAALRDHLRPEDSLGGAVPPEAAHLRHLLRSATADLKAADLLARPDLAPPWQELEKAVAAYGSVQTGRVAPVSRDAAQAEWRAMVTARGRLDAALPDLVLTWKPNPPPPPAHVAVFFVALLGALACLYGRRSPRVERSAAAPAFPPQAPVALQPVEEVLPAVAAVRPDPGLRERLRLLAEAAGESAVNAAAAQAQTQLVVRALADINAEIQQPSTGNHTIEELESRIHRAHGALGGLQEALGGDAGVSRRARVHLQLAIAELEETFALLLEIRAADPVRSRLLPLSAEAYLLSVALSEGLAAISQAAGLQADATAALSRSLPGGPPSPENVTAPRPAAVSSS